MRLLATAALALALSACGGTLAITGPVESTFAAHGLEQVIRIEPADPATFSRDPVVNLTSRLVNRGSAAVTVRVATCYLDPDRSLRGARFVVRALPGCIQTPDVITLAPGQASDRLWFVGEIHASGRATLGVRHALDPEFWGEIRVR
jgi:hypothetical protein